LESAALNNVARLGKNDFRATQKSVESTQNSFPGAKFLSATAGAKTGQGKGFAIRTLKTVIFSQL
jgi:hypothetical protein